MEFKEFQYKRFSFQYERYCTKSNYNSDCLQPQVLQKLSTKLEVIEGKIDIFEEKLKEFDKKLDNLELYGKANCLIIHGTKLDLKLNYEEFVNEISRTINNKIPLNQEVTPDGIEITHHLPPNKKKEIQLLSNFCKDQ